VKLTLGGFEGVRETFIFTQPKKLPLVFIPRTLNDAFIVMLRFSCDLK